MPLFEVAILTKPTKKEAEDGAQEKLVFGPKAVIARDIQSAGIAAILSETPKNPDGTAIDMSRAEVLVRPFA